MGDDTLGKGFTESFESGRRRRVRSRMGGEGGERYLMEKKEERGRRKGVNRTVM
jgi:hypothetical protein